MNRAAFAEAWRIVRPTRLSQFVVTVVLWLVTLLLVAWLGWAGLLVGGLLAAASGMFSGYCQYRKYRRGYR